MAVSPLIQLAAAVSNDMPDGMGSTSIAGTDVYSAYALAAM